VLWCKLLFSHPYLSNSRAIGTSCCLSARFPVRLSVCNECIVARLKVIGESFLRRLLAIFLELRRAKFQPSSARETFSNWGMNEGGIGNLMEN